MKKTAILILTILLVANATTFSQVKTKTKKTIVLKNSTDTLSYSLGMQFGKDLMQNNVRINPDIFIEAMKTILNNGLPLLTEEQAQESIMNLNNELRQKETEMQQKISRENLEKASAFLQKNSMEPGVKVTASGLQYKEVVPGTGISPTAEDTVEVHYTGKLINGQVFDSSIDRGQTIKFPLNQVIKGWTEGLQLMKEGGKSILYIPPALGYGERGAGGVIGPNEALIFEVELIKVYKKQ